MKGEVYEYAIAGSRRPIVIVYIPDADIQFQWTQPRSCPQVISTPQLLPPASGWLVKQVGNRDVPGKAIREARRYLKWQAHREGQQRVLQKAQERLAGIEICNERRLAEAARGLCG